MHCLIEDNTKDFANKNESTSVLFRSFSKERNYIGIVLDLYIY